MFTLGWLKLGLADLFLWSSGSIGFIYKGSYSNDKGGGIHERWFRWDPDSGQHEKKAPEEKI